MFFSRSRPSAPSMTGRLSNRSSLELAFKHSHTPAFRTDVMSELVDMKIGPPERFDSQVRCRYLQCFCSILDSPDSIQEQFEEKKTYLIFCFISKQAITRVMQYKGVTLKPMAPKYYS